MGLRPFALPEIPVKKLGKKSRQTLRGKVKREFQTWRVPSSGSRSTQVRRGHLTFTEHLLRVRNLLTTSKETSISSNASGQYLRFETEVYFPPREISVPERLSEPSVRGTYCY